MVTNKEEFVKTFLPDHIKDISFAQIDLDITDLSVSDILRNIDKTFPQNSRTRNAIIDGKLAVGVLCKTDLLYPISGLMLIISNGESDINVVSKNYIVIGMSEERIRSNEEIKVALDDITRYIIKEFKHSIAKFDDFYIKFVYDPYEEEMDQDGYETLDAVYRRIMQSK